MDAGFFSSLPPEPQEPPERPTWRPPPWLQPPADELPALLLASRVLARSDRAVLWMTTIDVFSTGIRIPVHSVVRRRDESARDWQARMHFRNPFEVDDDGRRFGMQLPDGTRLSTAHRRPLDFHEQEPEGGVLLDLGGGGGGGEDRWETVSNLWLWPLPPSGPIDLVLEWTAEGVPETRVGLDGGAMIEAVSRVQRMWAEA